MKLAVRNGQEAVNMLEQTLLCQIRDLTRLEKLEVLAFLAQELIVEEKSDHLTGGQYDEWSTVMPHPCEEKAQETSTAESESGAGYPTD
jgi:hypothetical protein